MYVYCSLFRWFCHCMKGEKVFLCLSLLNCDGWWVMLHETWDRQLFVRRTYYEHIFEQKKRVLLSVLYFAVSVSILWKIVLESHIQSSDIAMFINLFLLWIIVNSQLWEQVASLQLPLGICPKYIVFTTHEMLVYWIQ